MAKITDRELNYVGLESCKGCCDVKYLAYMQIKTLDLLYDVFSELLFKLTRFDTYRKKRFIHFTPNFWKCQILCYIRLDEHVMTQSDYTRSEITVQCGSVWTSWKPTVGIYYFLNLSISFHPSSISMEMSEISEIGTYITTLDARRRSN